MDPSAPAVKLPDPEQTRPQVFNDITIKFAGDSGDGIQLAGVQFARLSGEAGEAVRTLADFPPEIRSPAGSLGGVSGFQLRTGGEHVRTAGDVVDLLVAMNPAALKINLDQVRPNGIIIVNETAFKGAALKRAGYGRSPLDDGSLNQWRVFPVPIAKLTRTALKDLKLGNKEKDRSKNFFALGLICWLFPRPTGPVEDWIEQRFGQQPELAAANLRAFRAGWNYGETTEHFVSPLKVREDRRLARSGVYRFVNGNTALSRGLIQAARRAGVSLFLGGYPITPATEIMQTLSLERSSDVRVFQAEDEIAAIGAAIGASFAGALGVTSTSGPGLALMAEFIDLAVIAELPLVVINVQRAGPSTGIPTKTEQADLWQALYGRHGESPLPVLAAASPQDCFDTAVEAARIALAYMTPVIVLSDLSLASGAELWCEPGLEELPEMTVTRPQSAEGFKPYQRDPETLARPWAVPGMAGFEHVTGGLEKGGESGAVSYEAANHEAMVRLRADKIARVARGYPELEPYGDPAAGLLLVGWGSTGGAIYEAVDRLTRDGHAVAGLCLRQLNPLPEDLGELLRQHGQIVVVENNLGQLRQRLRSEYLIDVKPLNKIQGTTFRVSEITAYAESLLKGGPIA